MIGVDAFLGVDEPKPTGVGLTCWRPPDLMEDDLRIPEGNWEDWKVLTWSGEPGIHRWAPPGSTRPVLVSGRRPHFPVMRDLDEMIRATRYIAKRDEYQTMRKARDPKRALPCCVHVWIH